MENVNRNPAVNMCINQCVICFSEFQTKNMPRSLFEKLYKLCRKHLHSDIMKETLAANWDLSEDNSLLQLCQNCCESAVQLNDKTEQAEILQKCISELILMFSMGVLHRRSIIPNSNRKPDLDESVKNSILQVECTGLTEWDSWTASSSRPQFPVEPFLELTNNTEYSNPSEYDDPLFGTPGEDDENSMGITNVNDLDQDKDKSGDNSGKSSANFPAEGHFTTERDSDIPPVINIEDQRPPIPRRFILIARSSLQSLVLAKPPKGQRKTKLVPLVEPAEESSPSSNAESPPKKQQKQPEKPLYHLNPKDVRPGQDRKRVQKALHCRNYRLKKKQEAEEAIKNLKSEKIKLKWQLIMLKLQIESKTNVRKGNVDKTLSGS